MNRTEQLISDYLDGRLDAAGEQELAGLLQRDRELLGEFVELYRQHRLLAGQQEIAAPSTSVERVLAELRSEGKVQESPRVAEARPARKAGRSIWKRLFSFQLPPLPQAGWATAVAVCTVLVMVAGFLL